ncbi:MAG: sugar nucleotide-binding protein [Pseudomonadota bacterium]
MSCGRIIVAGGDSLIGGRLATALSAAGADVAATSRRGRAVYPLDLETMSAPPDFAAKADTLVIAAAITGRAACEAAPDLARRVNVEAPLALARPVLARGGHVVFLSTHIVLGGAAPFLATDAAYDPCDAYSAQKAEAERALLAHDTPGRLSIVRLTKVLDPASGVLANWSLAMAAGEPIDVYADLLMAPVGLDHVCQALTGIIGQGQGGITHVSGADEISYADFARLLGQRLGWSGHLIRAQAGRPVNPIAAATPPHASLQARDPHPLTDLLEALARQMAR